VWRQAVWYGTETILWQALLDEQGEQALLQLRRPVNRMPELVTTIVRDLSAKFPSFGNRRLAQLVARAGLWVSATTVATMRKTPTTPKPEPEPEPEAAEQQSSRAAEQQAAPPPAVSRRAVTAKAPNHVWHVDLTILPTGGFWVPWLPFSLPQVWPFCFWLGVVLDHCSRSVVAWQLFRKQPTGEEVVALFETGRKRAGATPKHVISDQGPQFGVAHRAWCAMRGVKPRYCAIGEHGSIATIERFFRSLKNEMFAKRIVPLGFRLLYAALMAYLTWCQDHRPHQGLAGLTPAERLAGAPPLAKGELLEPRARYPIRDDERRGRVCALQLVVESVDGRSHLPIVSLREAA